jgi:hypothetical protein
VIALALAAASSGYGWWLLIVWVIVLAALVGGRVMFIDHRPTRDLLPDRLCLPALALLFWLVPQVVPCAR